MKKFIVLSAAAVLGAVQALAASVVESKNSAFVMLEPEKTALWRTAPAGTFSVSVPYPPGVEKRAVLSVSGYRYSAEYEVNGGESFMLTLPAPKENSPDRENVYNLALTFADGSVKRARVGAIAGFDGSNEGSTRLIAPADGGRWGLVVRSAVIPVPYGTFSITVNGETVDTALDGAAGWFMLSPLAVGAEYNLAIDGVFATLTGGMDGTVLLVR